MSSPAGAGMRMVGNDKPYPNVAHAAPRYVARARALFRATRAAAPRFATVAKARRLGYLLTPNGRRPGFLHARKNGLRFWGRVFDAHAPQALVFWCPARGRCRLAAFMYRAPGGRPPSTWGDLLQWHRHGLSRAATWMTHVWLARDLRHALATCAPMRALGIRPQRYRPDIMADAPCGGMPSM